MAAMGIAIFANPSYGILATFIIDDHGLTRAQIGLLATAFSLVGALTSPFVGRAADRVGGKRALLFLFLISGIGLILISAAPTFALMLLAAMFAGLAQASANPSTNKLIGVNVVPGRRGMVTGIKQSGVQLGVFIGGMALPFLALQYGWRWSLGSFALVSLVGLIAAWRFIPNDPLSAVVEKGPKQNVPRDVYWLGAFGFLMGITVGAVFVYLPLYSTEVLGLSVTAAGVLAAMLGLFGAIARVVWAPIAERASHYAYPLLVIAVLSLISLVMLWIAPWAGVVFLVAGAILAGVSAPAWSSVGMLAVISLVPQTVAGRSSGVLVLGFALGIAIGPPLFGLSVDVTGSYNLGFAVMCAITVLGAVVVVLWRRSSASFPASTPTRSQSG